MVTGNAELQPCACPGCTGGPMCDEAATCPGCISGEHGRDRRHRHLRERRATVDCPLDIADCGMWADEGRIDMHYQPSEAPQPCFICGDPLDHYGHAHGVATGDGRTRADA